MQSTINVLGKPVPWYAFLLPIVILVLGKVFFFILSRIIVYCFLVSLGSCAAVALYISVIVYQSDDDLDIAISQKRKPLADFKPFAFLDQDKWKSELVALSEEKPLPIALFPESFVLSDRLDVLIEYVLRDFVLSWYRKFTTDTLFPAHVDHTIRLAVLELGRRVTEVDWADLLVRKIMPVVTEHFKQFVDADLSVRQKSLRGNLTESKELDYAIAAEFNGGVLHEAISLKSFEYGTYRKTWLRNRVSNILPYVVAKKEADVRVVSELVTDIASSSVLFPILTMLSDPDFWNQQVIKQGGTTIQDQEKVLQLREALDAHTRSSLQQPRNKQKRSTNKTLKLSPKADKVEFEKFIQDIYKCQSLPEAKQTRYYISLQLKRTIRENNNSTYVQRLKTARAAIDRQISNLSGTFLPPSEDVAGKDPREDYTLLQVLNDPSCSLFFMEFMDQRRRTMLLQFWLTVNSLKNPLEDNSEEAGDPLGGIQTSSRDIKSINMAHKNDMLQIYEVYFKSKNIISADADIVDPISEFASQNDPTPVQYLAARKALFQAQSAVYRRIEEGYLAKFKKSDLFLKYLASIQATTASKIYSSIDELQFDAVDPNEDIRTEISQAMSRPLSPKVVRDEELEKAEDIITFEEVEKAFNNIMQTPTKKSLLFGEDYDSGSISKKSLESKPESSHASSSSKTRLFDDDDDLDNSDSDDSELQLDTDDDDLIESNKQIVPIDSEELHLAAPGDLGLTEQISALTEEVEKLYTQEVAIDFLVKKAELTNNTADLRILRKSRASLEREIQRKELQRQQYIVQESDNSLYGRSDIQIQSYISSTDNGGQYILYIIEVQRIASDGGVSAGWVVSRRYNQFFQLHQYLRAHFQKVAKLDFPRKRVLLKFQQKSFVEARRLALQKYLKELLELPEVCRSKAFRLFLSSDTFSVDLLPQSSMASSVASLNDEEESSMESIGLKRKFNSGSLQEDVSVEIDPSEVVEGELKPFVQPICDMFIQIFGLNRGNNWLRGRAVVVVLQQLLGGTIEKKIKEIVNSMTTTQRLSDLVQTVTDIAWPGGQLKPPSVPRTSSEKVKCKHEAMQTLQRLIFNISSMVVGNMSSRYASTHLFKMYQIEILNAHLVYTIFDLLTKELFPELKNKY